MTRGKRITPIRLLVLVALVGGIVAAFMVAARASAPVPTSVTPAAAPNTGPVTVLADGTGYMQGAAVRLQKTDQPDVVATPVTFVSDRRLQATFDLTDVAPGRWNLRVTNADGGSGVCTGCFTVAASPPTVASSDGSAGRGATGRDVTFTGTNFFRGATVAIVGSGVVVNSTRWVSTSSVVANVDVTTDAPTGARDASVTNTDGQRGTCTACFTVNAAPSVTALTPSSLDRGASRQDVDVTGTGFADGAVVAFPGTGVTVHSVRFVPATLPTDSAKLVATLSVAPNAPSGDRDVVVTNPDGGSTLCGACFVVSSRPRITSLDPGGAGQGASSREVTIRGANFVSGADVSFGGGITVSGVRVTNATALVATVDVDDFATAGKRTVVVTNPDGEIGVDCTDCFTVAAAPRATKLTPSARGQGATGHDVTVEGTGIVDGARAAFSGSGITVTDTAFVAGNAVVPASLRITVDLQPGATAGPRDVVLQNPDGGRGTCLDCFTVSAAPTVATLDPPSRGRGAANQDVLVGGANFVQGATVAFSGAGITVNSASVQNADQIRANISVASTAAPGPRNVTVTNPDGATPGVCANCFAVNAPPTIASVSPGSQERGTAGEISLTGTGFQAGASVSFGEGVGVNDVSVTDPRLLLVSVSIASDATTGVRTVTVSNADGGPSASCTSCFIVDGGLTVTDIVPKAAPNSAAVNMTITGTDFTTGAAVKLSAPGQPDVPGTAVTVDKADSLRATFDVTGAAPGSWDVRVTNPATQPGTNVCAACFTVASSAPRVTATNPSTLGQGTEARDVTITGTNFARGADATFSGTGITVNSTTFSDRTTLVANVSVAPNAAVGTRSVTVTNTDTQAATCTGCFAIRAAPALTSFNPGSRGQGAQNQTLSGTGGGLEPGATVAFSGTGITVNSTTVRSATSLTTNVSIASDAAPGPRDVTIRNPDGSTGRCAGCFAVNAAPAVSSLAPASRGQGADRQDVTVTGSGFLPGARASFSGSGIAVNETAVQSATKLIATITIAPDATIGPRDATATNPDGGTAATCTACFTVNAGPEPATATPPSRGQGAAGQDITIEGRHLAAGAKVSFSGSGITVNSVTFAGPVPSAPELGRLVADITIADTAASGERDITVTNPDAGVGVCTDCFTVNALPSVTSVAPSSRGQGISGAEVTVTGTGFKPAATVAFSGTGITVTSTNVTSATSIVAMVDIAPDAPAGDRDVRIQNPDGGSARSCGGCFTVTAKPGVTRLTPATRGQGATDQDVTVTGTGFASAASVSFSGTGVSVRTTQFVNSTTLVATVLVAADAAEGTRDVAVTNFDEGTGVCTRCFTVSSAPTVTSASPATRGQGARDEMLRLTGTGFVDGATAAFSGSGIAVTEPDVTGATALEVTVSIAPAAATGARNITVTNGDGGVSAACTECFTVARAPAVTGLAPAAITQGAPAQGVTLTGSGFHDGATVSIGGQGVRVNGVTFVPATPIPGDEPELMANLTVEPDAVLGARDVVVRNADGGIGACARCFTVDAARGRFTPLSPVRILDTRFGTGGVSGRLAPDGTVDVQVAGRGGVPSSGVSAVVLNATAVEPSAPGYMTIFPAGAPRPTASNLNFAPGQTVPNLVTVKVGRDGKVSAYNASGTTHLIFDIAGWYDMNPSGNAGRLQPLTPSRVLDTRSGTGGVSAPIGPDQTVELQITDRGGVPLNGAAAVVLNATAVEPTSSGFLTLFPAGDDRPLASNLNFAGGRTIANRVVVKLGDGGRIAIYNAAGATHAIVDVNAWITDATVGSGTPGALTALQPSRILDTRFGTGGISDRFGAGQTRDVRVTGLEGVPAGASAVVLNVTVVEPTEGGYLTIFPAGEDRPTASDVNFAAGATVPNLVVVKAGADGKVAVFNATGSAHVIFDVAGWFS